MKKKKFVVYWDMPTGSNVHHYFPTYNKALEYVKNVDDKRTRIAKVVFNDPTEIQEILQEIVNEMYIYGKFISQERASNLIDRIKEA